MRKPHENAKIEEWQKLDEERQQADRRESENVRGPEGTLQQNMCKPEENARIHQDPKLDVERE
jgi:hypothetical protein